MECGCSLIRYVQTDHPRFSCCQIGLYLFFAQPQTVLVIHNDICSVFRNRSLQRIQACFITEAVIRVALLYQLLCILQIHSGSISLALHIRTISTILVRSFIVNETCLFQSTVNDVQCSFRRNVQAAFGKEELIDGIPYSDWNDYIGKAAPVYLNDYSRMQLQHTKISMCFSALVFGPFYFFYRKAWKPAFGFLAAELVVALPTLLSMMQATGSPLTAGISSTAIVVLSRIMTVFSFALVMLRTLYAKWLYRKSAAERIRRIRAEFPDAAQRRAVLSAQGGVSIAGVIGAFVLLMVLGACATVLMGPNLDALAGMI